MVDDMPAGISPAYLAVASKNARKQISASNKKSKSHEGMMSVVLGKMRLDGSFVIETNGVSLGADPSLIDILKPLQNIHVRLCIKAHSGADFEKITGAMSEGLAYQLAATKALRKMGISHTIAVMQPFVDPDCLPVPVDEIEDLISYGSTERNLIRRGLSLKT